MKTQNRRAFLSLVEILVVIIVVGIIVTAVVQGFRTGLKVPEVNNSIIQAVQAYEEARGQLKNNMAMEILGSFGDEGDLRVLVTFVGANGRNYYLVNANTGEISVMFRLTAEEMATMFPAVSDQPDDESADADPDN